MTHEQKPESAEFRTRAEQHFQLGEALADEVGDEKYVQRWHAYALKHILEAEARGAAEQRRRDAEGEEGIITYEEALRRKCANDVTPAFMGSMMKISKLISWLQDVHSDYGDTCVYARSLSWGAVALNKEGDDRKALSAEKHAAWTDISPLEGVPVANVAALEARVKELEEELGALLDWADGQWCPHDNTHRGGSIWTICNDCGRKWADDVKPFDPDEDFEPSAIKQARAAIREGGEHG